MKHNNAKKFKRCGWVTDDPVYQLYHDTEWGVPVYDNHQLFEFLILEGAQAGLSWLTILKKREHYRACFDRFDPIKIAKYDQKKITQLLANPGIIRNRLKIEATIANAKAYLKLLDEGNDFANYLWDFVDDKPIKNSWKTSQSVPTRTNISDAMANDLKKRGFKFFGTTICYAFMQAVGMVNDHTVDCFCYK
jgi:DNA-3-methyladenine glycosylase I